jgi:hypothetical protein
MSGNTSADDATMSFGYLIDALLSSSTAIRSMLSPDKLFPAKTHAPSGYSWARPEDEPGHAWLNPKAMDEATRAWENLVHKESMVKGKSRFPRSSERLDA